jgi:excisionase family DNA binding protein
MRGPAVASDGGGAEVDALLLKIPEVAQRLSLSRAKVYELIAAGALTSVEIDGCRRVRATDLRAYVDALTSAS